MTQDDGGGCRAKNNFVENHLGKRGGCYRGRHLGGSGKDNER